MNRFTLARATAILMLLAATARWPYGFYTLLRFIVCGTAAFGAFRARERQSDSWMWVLGGLAIFFNPVFPMRLDRDSWAVADIVAAVVLAASFLSPSLHQRASG